MSFFITGGTVQAEDGVYVERSADDELLALCEQREFAYVLTPRQMGKSSLMEATAARLVEQDVVCVVIDLQKIGTPKRKEAWYLGVLQDMADQLMLDTEVYDWWQQYPHLGETQRLTRFFEEILLSEIDEQIVVFVDEIDTTLSLDYTDDFFIAIRYFYTARSQNEELNRLSFVLIGVAMPGDLIKDSHRTPFNIGERVDLSDFSLGDVASLSVGLGLPLLQSQQVMEWVLNWTGGHPYLTQKLCQSLVIEAAEQEQFEWSERVVTQVMRRTFLEGGDRSDQNLQFVRNMLVSQSPELEGGLRTYRAVWKEQAVEDDEQSLVKSHLKLSGIVRQDDQRTLVVRNEIYRQVFDSQWIKEHLPENWFRRYWPVLRIAGPVTAASIFAATGMFYLRAEANKQREIAIERSEFAIAQQEIAEINLLLAEEKTAEAERNAAEAEKQENIAQQSAEEARQSAEEAKRQTEFAEASAIEAEEQTIIARRQADLAEQRRTESEEASQRAEAARATATEQRARAEEQTIVAQEEKARAEAQTQVAQTQAVLAQANASRAFLLAGQPLEAIVTAVRTWRQVAAWQQNTEQNLSPDAERRMVGPAQAALIQGVYNDKAFNLNNMKASDGDYYPSRGFRESNQIKLDGNSFTSVVFSPNGNTIASASDDGTIKLWDRQGSLLEAFEGHDEVVTSLAFTPDGNTIASASDDGTIKLWNQYGSLLYTIEEYGRDLAFSSDGSILAATNDREIRLWNRQGKLINILKGHDESVTKVTFSSNDSTLASASADGTIKLWDKQGALLNTLEGHRDWVWGVAFSPDGNTLASASYDGIIKLWDKQGTLLDTFEGHSDPITSLAFSPDGDTLASASYDDTIKLWNQHGILLNTLEGHTGRIAFSPDGNTLAAISDRTVKLWSRQGSLVNTLDDRSWLVRSVAFSPDGDIVASGDGDDTVKLWNRQGGLLTTLEGHSGWVLDVAFSPDGNTVASASADHTIKLWSRQGTLLTTLEGHSERVESVAFSPDNGTIASASFDGTIKLWDRQGLLLNTLENFSANTFSNGVSDVAFSPGGSILAAANYDGTIKLWDRQGNHLNTLRSHSDVASSIVFSPDGKILVSASDDRTVKLWDERGNLLNTLDDFDGRVNGLAFSPDGNVIASASDRYNRSVRDDGVIKLWDRQGNLLNVLEGHSDGVVSVVFSPDGNTIVSASADSTIRLWDINPTNLLTWSCRWLRDYLDTHPEGKEARAEGVCDEYI